MSALPRIHRAQRVALLAAIAAALDVVGRYLIGLGGGTPAHAGWFGYAPLTESDRLPFVGLSAWVQLLIWLGLIVVWALLALWLLRPPGTDN